MESNSSGAGSDYHDRMAQLESARNYIIENNIPMISSEEFFRICAEQAAQARKRKEELKRNQQEGHSDTSDNAA